MPQPPTQLLIAFAAAIDRIPPAERFYIAQRAVASLTPEDRKRLAAAIAEPVIEFPRKHNLAPIGTGR